MNTLFGPPAGVSDPLGSVTWPDYVCAATGGLMVARGPGGGYGPRHPWHYLCGGRPARPRHAGSEERAAAWGSFIPRLPRDDRRALSVLETAWADGRREYAAALRLYGRALAERPVFPAGKTFDEAWRRLIGHCEDIAVAYARVATARGILRAVAGAWLRWAEAPPREVPRA